MATSTIKQTVTNIIDDTYTNGNIGASYIAKNTNIKLAEISLSLRNLTSGSSSWQTLTTNDSIFPKPINKYTYGQLAFQGQGDFRIINDPFSIDVNLRGGTNTTPTLHAMYFYA